MDDNELIYIALSNNILSYNQLIEGGIEDPEELQLAEYIIYRSLQLIDTYGAKINQAIDAPIQKPKWR